MRNLPPRMSNQPPRKAWEIETSNEALIAAQGAKASKVTTASDSVTTSVPTSISGTIAIPVTPAEPQPSHTSYDENYHADIMARNQQIYDDTGSRLTYRGGWIARGGRGWGG